MAFKPSKTFLRTFNVVTLALTFYVLIGGLSYGHPMLLNIYKFTAWWGVFCQATAYLATYVAWKENKLDTLVPFTVPKWLSATVEASDWPRKFRDAYKKAKTPQTRAKIAAARIEHFIETKGKE